jgi:hypothetical protein
LRFLDLAVAALIGAASIASFWVWNPGGYGLQSWRAQEETNLDVFLTNHVNTFGLLLLQDANFHDLCMQIVSLSNSTLAVSAILNSTPCAPQPTPHAVTANLTLGFPSRVVVIEAWYTAGR